MTTFPLALLDPEAIEGATSVSDKAIARALNETRAAVNELAATLAELRSNPEAPTVMVVLTAEQQEGLAGLPIGSSIVLVTADELLTTRVMS